MSKPLIGVILGAVLGAIDGLTAWFTPAVRDQLFGIVFGSTIKGIIAGVAIGFFARKFHSLPIGILFGVWWVRSSRGSWRSCRAVITSRSSCQARSSV